MITIVQIRANQTHQLRQQLLRPTQSVKEMDFPGDRDSTTKHFGAVEGTGELVGIASIFYVQHKHLTDAHWQLRMMATISRVRRYGVGKALVREIESYCKLQSLAPCIIWANARIGALEFYQSMGYLSKGDEFELPPIGPHQLIYKHII